MKKIPLILAAVLLLGVLLGGCFNLPLASTGPKPSYTPSPEIGPLLLIPKADAERLVGNALQAPVIMPTAHPATSAAASATPVPTGSPAASVGPTATPAANSNVFCFYETAVKGGRFMQITLMQTTEAMAANSVSAKDYYDAQKGKGPSTVGDPSLTMVKGVGDEAFMLPPGIHILFKGYYIVIGVGDPTVQANQDILMAAGKLAVKNLAAILGVPEPTEAPAASLEPSPSATSK